MQSFFPIPHRHLFTIQTQEVSLLRESGEKILAPLRRHQNNDTHSDSSELLSTQLAREYQSVCQAYETASQQVPAAEEVSQIPPWIHQLGIHERWRGLEKSWVSELIAPIPINDPVLECVQSLTNRFLYAVRNQILPGKRHQRLSRIQGRILNSFEPKRTAIKPFTLV